MSGCVMPFRLPRELSWLLLLVNEASEFLDLGHSLTHYRRVAGDNVQRKEIHRPTVRMQLSIPLPATEPPMLTPEQIVQLLRDVRTQMSLPDPAPVPGILRRRLGHVNADFVVAAINAIGATAAVEAVLGCSAEELRQETDASVRWSAVADELRALLQSVLVANALRRQRIGLAALQTYKICQQLVREDGQALRLGAHVAEMKRLNRFGRGQKPASVVPAPQSKTP